MFQQLNPFAPASAAAATAAATAKSEEQRSDNTHKSNEGRTQRALKAFLAASHTDAELVKIVSQLQATAFRQPSEIDGTYQRKREETQSAANGSQSDSTTLPPAAKSRQGAHPAVSPGGPNNESDESDDDDDVFGMEDGGVVVDEYVGDVLRSRAQSALSAGSFGSQPRQRLASWDEFGSEAADIGLAAPLVAATGGLGNDSDAAAKESRGTKADSGREDVQRHDADGPIIDADGAGADDADNAFVQDATDAFAIGGASDDENNAFAADSDDPVATEIPTFADDATRGRLSSDVADEFGDGGDAADDFGDIPEVGDGDGDGDNLPAADEGNPGKADDDLSEGNAAEGIGSETTDAIDEESDKVAVSVEADGSEDDGQQENTVEQEGSDSATVEAACAVATETQPRSSEQKEADDPQNGTPTDGPGSSVWDFARTNLPAAWALCSNVFGAEIRALRARAYDLEHMLHNESQRRVAAEARAEAADARARKSAELLHEFLKANNPVGTASGNDGSQDIKGGPDNQSSGSDLTQQVPDDDGTRQDLPDKGDDLRMSGRLAQALEASEVQLTAAAAKTTLREDMLAETKMDLMLEQQRVAMVTAMFREISGAASTLERSLIRAGSLPAASVVTAAKTRAIRGFADFEATLASTRLVRDRLADEAQQRQKQHAANQALRIAAVNEVLQPTAAGGGRTRSMTMEEGVVREGADFDSEDEEEVDLVMKKLRQLVKKEGTISYSRVKFSLIEAFGESAFAGRKVQIQQWLEDRTTPKQKPAALTLLEQQRHDMEEQERRSQLARDEAAAIEKIRQEEVREAQEAARRLCYCACGPPAILGIAYPFTLYLPVLFRVQAEALERANRPWQPPTKAEAKAFFDSIKVGARVRIVGLQKNLEYNHQFGEVLKKNRQTLRLRVKLISIPALFGKTVTIPAANLEKFDNLTTFSADNISSATEIAKAMDAVQPKPRPRRSLIPNMLIGNKNRQQARGSPQKKKSVFGKSNARAKAAFSTPQRESDLSWKTFAVTFSTEESLGVKLQPLHPTDERTRIGFLPTGQAQKLGLRQGDVFVQVGDLDLGPGASAVDFLRKAVLDGQNGTGPKTFPVLLVRGGRYGVNQYDKEQAAKRLAKTKETITSPASAAPAGSSDESQISPARVTDEIVQDDDLDDADAFLASQDQGKPETAPAGDNPTGTSGSDDEEDDADQQIAIDEDESDTSSSDDDEYEL